MKVNLAEMPMDEFLKTYPILLKEYNPEYKYWYESEKESILNVVKTNDIARINHIGSSAVEGLVAKPTIDILLEIDGRCHVAQLIEELRAIGYGKIISTKQEDPMKVLLGKGYTPDGYAEKVFHLHIRYIGDWDELYFRDYLIANPDVSAKYGRLKLDIINDIENGTIARITDGVPNGYSNAKFEFVKKYSIIAKQEFQDRYKCQPSYR